MIFAQSNNKFNYFYKSFVISKHMGVFTKYLIIIVRYIISKMRKRFVKNNKVFIRMLVQKWFHPIAQINAKTRVIKLWKVSEGFCRNAMESWAFFFISEWPYPDWFCAVSKLYYTFSWIFKMTSRMQKTTFNSSFYEC